MNIKYIFEAHHLKSRTKDIISKSLYMKRIKYGFFRQFKGEPNETNKSTYLQSVLGSIK